MRVLEGRMGRWATEDLEGDRQGLQSGRKILDRSLRTLRTAPWAALLVGLLCGFGPAEAQAGVWEVLDPGDTLAEADPLRQMFEESTLVVFGTTGASVPSESNGRRKMTVTSLRLELVLRGHETARQVQIHHEASLAPGTRILAFLKPGSAGAYEPIDASYALKALPDEAFTAYRERLESLARLPRDPSLHPDDLAEWLVATAEEPLTRKAAVVEIGEALDALGDFAQRQRTSEDPTAGALRTSFSLRLSTGQDLESEPAPALIAAFFTDRHRERLSQALLASSTLDLSDLTLYEIVRSWDGEEALSWLAQQVGEVDPGPTADAGIRILEALAQGLGRAKLQDLVLSAQDRLIAIYSHGYPDEGFLRETEVERQLLTDFRQELAAAR